MVTHQIQTDDSLEHVYFEDSWILGLTFDADQLCFTCDLVLLDSHPQYSAPRDGEQYCYLRGELTFDGVTELHWLASGVMKGVDATGETDLGSFDQFEVSADGQFVVSSDYGTVQGRCAAVNFTAGEQGPERDSRQPHDPARASTRR